MIECFVTYELISQRVPWEEKVRLTAFFTGYRLANLFVFEKRKDPAFRLVEVGLPTVAAWKMNAPYQHFVNVTDEHLKVYGDTCIKCQLNGDDPTSNVMCPSNA